MNTILKNQPTFMTKEKAENVAFENNRHDNDGVYSVRCINELKGYYVVDLMEEGIIAFTL